MRAIFQDKANSPSIALSLIQKVSEEGFPATILTILQQNLKQLDDSSKSSHSFQSYYFGLHLGRILVLQRHLLDGLVGDYHSRRTYCDDLECVDLIGCYLCFAGRRVHPQEVDFSVVGGVLGRDILPALCLIEAFPHIIQMQEDYPAYPSNPLYNPPILLSIWLLRISSIYYSDWIFNQSHSRASWASLTLSSTSPPSAPSTPP